MGEGTATFGVDLAPVPITRLPLGEVQTLGTFRILHELGQGSTGVAFLAVDTESSPLTSQDGRPVVVKVFNASTEASHPRDEMAMHRLVGSSGAPNILPLVAAGRGLINEDPSQPFDYLVTPYAYGGTLRSRMEKQKISVPEAIDLADQGAVGLAGVHKGRIVHRDVNPNNLFLAGPTLLVADFGTAKPEGPHDRLYAELTAGYAPPDLVVGLNQPAIDQFGLATVFAEMVAGESVFPRTGSEYLDIIFDRRNYADVMTSRVRKIVPGPFQTPVIRALAHDPDARFDNVIDFSAALRNNHRNSFASGPSVAYSIPA